MRLTVRIIIALTIGLCLAFASAYAETIRHGDLTLQHIVIRTAPPGAKTTAGYLQIINHGGQDDRLISVAFEGAGRAAIHQMTVDDGIMKMRAIDGGVVIPAGGTVALKPGGLHLMLMRLTNQLEDGDSRELTLVFERSGKVTVSAPIKKIP
jgi:copper(I)-binding protein